MAISVFSLEKFCSCPDIFCLFLDILCPAIISRCAALRWGILFYWEDIMPFSINILSITENIAPCSWGIEPSPNTLCRCPSECLCAIQSQPLSALVNLCYMYTRNLLTVHFATIQSLIEHSWHCVIAKLLNVLTSSYPAFTTMLQSVQLIVESSSQSVKVM